VKGINITITNDILQLFEKEKARLKDVSDTGFAPIYLDDFVQENCPYYVQEYIPGNTLQSKLEEDPHFFNQLEIRRFLTETLNALVILHSRNILHRDLKLSNIMLRRSDGKYMLIDFGVSKLLMNTQSSYTQVGTPLYMPPEMQIEGKSTVKTDLYCLGLCAVALISGTEQSINDSNLGMLQQVRTKLTDNLLIQCITLLIEPNPNSRASNAAAARALLS